MRIRIDNARIRATATATHSNDPAGIGDAWLGVLTHWILMR